MQSHHYTLSQSPGQNAAGLKHTAAAMPEHARTTEQHKSHNFSRQNVMSVMPSPRARSAGRDTAEITHTATTSVPECAWTP